LTFKKGSMEISKRFGAVYLNMRRGYLPDWDEADSAVELLPRSTRKLK
jgi:hypothetical protein